MDSENKNEDEMSTYDIEGDLTDLFDDQDDDQSDDDLGLDYENDIYNARRLRMAELKSKRDKSVKRQRVVIVVSAVFVVVIIALIFILSASLSQNKGNKTSDETDAAAENADAGEDDVDSSGDEEDSENLTGQLTLLDEDSEIYSLISNYYIAISACDIDSLQTYLDDIGDITEDSLEALSSYIESYENLECYTKPGLNDGEYVVYVYYELKILNIETLAPGADTLYVISDGDSYLIHNYVTTGEIYEYIVSVSSEDDVLEFFEDVDSKLASACASDDDLNDFYEALLEASESSSSSGDADEDGDAEEAGEEADEESDSDEADEESDAEETD